MSKLWFLFYFLWTFTWPFIVVHTWCHRYLWPVIGWWFSSVNLFGTTAKVKTINKLSKVSLSDWLDDWCEESWHHQHKPREMRDIQFSHSCLLEREIYDLRQNTTGKNIVFSCTDSFWDFGQFGCYNMFFQTSGKNIF